MDIDQDKLFQFPCEFPIKIMGRTQADFQDQVIAILNNHVSHIPDHAISSKPSRKGNYISVTVTITATDREQLDNIYRELSACEAVLMTL